MVRSIIFFILIVTFCIPTSMVMARDLKIGYIISEAIREDYEEFQAAQRTLDEEKAEWEQQYEAKVQEIIDMEKDLQDKEFVYSDTRKQEIRATIETKKQELYTFEQDLTNRLIQRNSELSAPINNKINEVLNRIGDEEGYDFIFDANQGNIVYAKDDYDLTERLLEELERE